MPEIARRAHKVIAGSPFLDQTARSGWGVTQSVLRPVKLKRYFGSTDMVRVMIGAGPGAKKGWLATDLTPTRSDVVLLDAGKRFPFDDRTVDRIHTEHMIEHVPFDVGQNMLRECFRVMKPGGRIRIATPDYDRVVGLARDDVPADVRELYRQSNLRAGTDPQVADEAIFTINRLFSGHFHRFLYSELVLGRELEKVGFVGVTRYDSGVTDDPEFEGLDQHGNQIDPEWNKFQTLVLEAEKPRP